MAFLFLLYSCVNQNPIHELNDKVHFICLFIIWGFG